ncbi:acyl-CoA dehydrogenase family protein [Azospirillum sp. sgz302134]
MSDTSHILSDTAHRLFAERFTPEALRDADAGLWQADAWAAIEELGLPLALVPEEAGGFGLDPVEALDLVRIAGAYAAPVPLAETMLAAKLLAEAGLEVPAGPLSVAPVHHDDRLTLTRSAEGWRLTGTARRVPWGRVAAGVAVLAPADGAAYVVSLHPEQWVIEPEANLAGEPRDTLRIDATLQPGQMAPAANGADAMTLRAMGATVRSLALAGAIGRVLELTTRYAEERVQFGRAIGKFQAIQQNLAVLAGHAVAAGAAADGAAEAMADGLRLLPIAAAKIRCGEAAGVAASIAHQVHGAIGFTQEHALHHLTRRLWSWREEFGGEAAWSRVIGQRVAAAGADGLWPLITAA